MTLFSSDVREKPYNFLYPNKYTVTDLDSFREAVSHDYVCAEYQENHRANDNFIQTDCLAMDIDNDDTEDPSLWTTPDQVQAMFPNVPILIHYSRNNMVEKKGKPPRPKFHVLMCAEVMKDGKKYSALKDTVNRFYPVFDTGALDAARYFNGTEDPETEMFPGTMTINAFLEQQGIEIKPDEGTTKTAAGTIHWDDIDPDSTEPILPGIRHKFTFEAALRLLKRYGDTDKARDRIAAVAARCDPRLPEKDIDHLMDSALTYFRNEISKDPNYLPPEQFELMPGDDTDVGEAEVFTRQYGWKLRFNEATGWMVYDGSVWRADEVQAQGLVQGLTARQLKLARSMVREAQDREAKAAEGTDQSEQAAAKEHLAVCLAFRKFVLDRRKSARISATLTEAKPMQSIRIEDLDADPYLLNTPGGAVDLRTGNVRKNSPKDYCTKITGAIPGEKGKEIWQKFLADVTSGDSALADCLQIIAGMFCVGQVLQEKLVIVYGDGGNGKSSFFNALAKTLGNYAGGIASDVLITGNHGNKKPELAELRGMRLVIAAELDEGTRLDTGTLKKLCSTDPIRGEAKYMKPFSFVPTHSLVLYSNHLPRVGSSDSGTWDRIMVIPFTARFRGKDNEILNYGEYLFSEAGEAILQWMIDGAVEFTKQNGRIILPDCVKDACQDYRRDNDWLADFLRDCTESGKGFQTASGALYSAYRDFCSYYGTYTRSISDFRAAVEKAGFDYNRTSSGVIVHGLELKPCVFTETSSKTPFD